MWATWCRRLELTRVRSGKRGGGPFFLARPAQDAPVPFMGMSPASNRPRLGFHLRIARRDPRLASPHAHPRNPAIGTAQAPERTGLAAAGGRCAPALDFGRLGGKNRPAPPARPVAGLGDPTAPLPPPPGL